MSQSVALCLALMVLSGCTAAVPANQEDRAANTGRSDPAPDAKANARPADQGHLPQQTSN